MPAAAAGGRPKLATRDTLDAAQLKGSLGRNGVASLQAEVGSHRSATPDRNGSAIRSETTGAKNVRLHSESAVADEEDDDVDASDTSIENYDDLELDPDTLVANSRKSMDDSYRPAAGPDVDADGENELGRTRSEPGRKQGHKKRNSIQVRLEKTDRKGRYILTADDPEIRDILKKGLEREEADAGNSKKARIRFRDLIFTRQFTTFDRQNPASADSPFFGFFTLFWICMGWLIFQVSLKNRRDYGSVLGPNNIMKMMFSHDVFVLGITDGVLCAATFITCFLQLLVCKGYINWSKTGWIIQNLWQTIYLLGLIGWAYFREWPWTHTIFAVLHGLVFLMKQHSFAFYNGYLSAVYRRRNLLQQKLKQLQSLEPIRSTPTSPRASRHSSDFTTGLELQDLARKFGSGEPSSPTLTKRRLSMGPRTSTDLLAEKSDVASVASAIQAGAPISQDQMETFEEIIKLEIADLTKELQGKSAASDGSNAYPRNLRLANFAEFICLPTLVYELEYPRQDRRNWWYIAEKLAATFGVLCIMMVISQAFIYPPVARAVEMKEQGLSVEERWREFPFIMSDMLFPLLIEQLLTWYLIWECILNVLAELTLFADRGFYGDWWNSTTFDQYARDWNRPVHNFLLRHVYHSSISTFHLSKSSATFVTFLLSALVHEMCMALMFKKVRGYLFWSQLLQIPLVIFSRSRAMKGRVVLGNVVFWVGLFFGPSFLTSLYLVI
jgi:sterol O-acyltransferase